MRLNTNQYKASYRSILNLHDKGVELSMIAISVGMPIVSIILVIQKYRGTNEYLDKTYTSIVNFYSYSEIVPLEDYKIE